MKSSIGESFMEIQFENLEEAELIVNCIYKGGTAPNISAEPFHKLIPGCENAGGFRKKLREDGSGKYAYIILYTSMKEVEWPDFLEEETGIFQYYGDNREPGRVLTDTKKKGNLILKTTFDLLNEGNHLEDIPPFFVFKNTGNGRDVQFLGLAAPGNSEISIGNDLIIISKNIKEKTFENYKAYFTILDTGNMPISKEWIRKLIYDHKNNLEYAPEAWKKFIKNGRDGIEALKIPKHSNQINKKDITSIRILPNDKNTFKKQSDFKYFIENTMIKREGIYYFPNLMMNCPKNTLVLFQYEGKIQAVGVIVDSKKEKIINEKGVEYSGYYKFDIQTLKYLDKPVNKEMLKSVYSLFKNFNQIKQIVPIEYLDRILDLLQDYCLNNTNDEDRIILEIENSELTGAEKEALVKIRINQGIFRDKLLKRYKRCCLCGVRNPALAIASHIKPWAACKVEEKIDIENGFLMCPNHDKLFDEGWISFDDNGRIMISDRLQENDKVYMNIRGDMKIDITDKNREYLEFHRRYVYKG